MRNGDPRFVARSPWTDVETDMLAEYISRGWSFERAGRKLGRTKCMCIGRFRRHIAKPLGWQAA